ncbi:MAG: hypothetical protein SGJ18_04145 [Pseudomonadota bacterium]|nr:hypothetical protein [Pseudomonadota bacterium]
MTKMHKRDRKNGRAVTSYVLIFAMIFSPVYGLAQEKPAVQEASDSEIKIDVSDPMPVEKVFPLTEMSEGGINNTLAYFMTPEMYEAIYHRLETQFWQPIKSSVKKTSAIYGYAAINIPRVAQGLKEAFRHPLQSGKNVTIVTTFLGTASTIISFTVGNISANDASVTRLVSTAVMLLGIAAVYRANFDTIGTFLNYKGWSHEKTKKNHRLQLAYEENIKNGKDERPEGLEVDKFSNRLAKIFLVEIFFLAAVNSWEFAFPVAEKTSEVMHNFWMSTAGYTLFSFYEAILTRFLIKAKLNVVGSTPEEIELKRNKAAFAYKVASLSISFTQNLAVMYALSGSQVTQYGMIGLGMLLIGYEFHASRKRGAAVRAFSCAGQFAH